MKSILIRIFILIFLINTNCVVKKDENNIDKSTFKKDSILGINYSQELCQMYGLDQGIRSNELKFNKSVIMPSIDSLNFKKLVSLVEKYDYPNSTNIEYEILKQPCVYMAAPAILLHNPHRLINEPKYFDLFLNQIKKGKMDATFFADIIDKYFWLHSYNTTERRVLIGSQFGKPCIQTKDKTNKIRIEIGLKPLADNEFLNCENEDLSIMFDKLN